MSRRSFVFILCVMLGVAAVGLPCAGRSEQLGGTASDLDKNQIIDRHQKFWASFAERDLWTQGQIWDKDDKSISAIFPAASTPAVGWDNVSENFRRAYSHNRDIRADARVVRLYRAGDMAWLIATVRFAAIQTQTGQPVMIPRLFATEIFSKRTGTWKIVHYHGHNPEFIVPVEGPENMVFNVVTPKRSTSPIWKAYDKFNAAFQARNLATMFETLDEENDVSSLQPTSPVPFLGLENVLAGWKKTFADTESLTSDAQVVELSESGPVGWITELSQYHIVFRDHPDEVRHFHNVMTTFIFRKVGDEWRLAHHHAHIGFSFDDHAH